VSANIKAASSPARERIHLLLDEAPSRSSTNLFVTVASDFGMQDSAPPATALLPASAASMAAWSMFSHRISPFFGRFALETNALKSARSWTWPCAPGSVIGLKRSGGRAHSGRRRLARGYADISPQHVASGVIRRSAPSWACAGGRCTPSHHRFHLHDARDLVHVRHWTEGSSKTVTHEEVTKQELGGAMTHNEKSGVAHFVSRDDADCLAMIRELMGFLPSNNLEDPPRRATADTPVRR